MGNYQKPISCKRPIQKNCSYLATQIVTDQFVPSNSPFYLTPHFGLLGQTPKVTQTGLVIQ